MESLRLGPFEGQGTILGAPAALGNTASALGLGKVPDPIQLWPAPACPVKGGRAAQPEEEAEVGTVVTAPASGEPQVCFRKGPVPPLPLNSRTRSREDLMCIKSEDGLEYQKRNRHEE